MRKSSHERQRPMSHEWRVTTLQEPRAMSEFEDVALWGCCVCPLASSWVLVLVFGHQRQWAWREVLRGQRRKRLWEESEDERRAGRKRRERMREEKDEREALRFIEWGMRRIISAVWKTRKLIAAVLVKSSSIEFFSTHF